LLNFYLNFFAHRIRVLIHISLLFLFSSEKLTYQHFLKSCCKWPTQCFWRKPFYTTN